MSTQESLVERMRHAVLMHQANEEPHIELYRELAAKTSDPIAQLVLESIAEDEVRHHETMSAMVRRLTIEMEKGGSAGKGDKGLVSDLKELSGHEQFGVKRLNEIAAEYKGIDGGLPSALLESIALDSEKHDRLLKFFEGRAGA